MILIVAEFSADDKGILPLLSLFAAFSYRIMPSVMNLTRSLNVFRSSDAVIRQLYKENNITYSVTNLEDRSPKKSNIDVAIRELSFSYPNQDEKLFSNLNYVIKAKRLTGIAGKSGVGKSTLLNLILGFNHPTEGRVEYFSGDEKISLEDFQNSVAFIPQEVELFEATIKENIALPVEGETINQQKFEEAVRLAGAEFVGLGDEKVLESGINLSGGQKQRIVIARALYHDRSVLVLDEITSALDNKNTKKIMQHVRNLAQHTTVILVSHDDLSLSMCDELLYLE
jgi:ABC-type bacteriocin/lantibiotic exporter with double-glycine peptidase domain